MGVYRLALQILTLFQTKKCHFPHPFSDLTSKIHTIPISDQKGPKTLPEESSTYLYGLYKGVFPPPPPGFQVLLKGLCHEDIAALGQFCAEVISFCLLPLHKILL